jgi:hypothetical protein
LKSKRVSKNDKKQAAELADGLAAFFGVPFIWYTEAGDGSRPMLTLFNVKCTQKQVAERHSRMQKCPLSYMPCSWHEPAYFNDYQ